MKMDTQLEYGNTLNKRLMNPMFFYKSTLLLSIIGLFVFARKPISNNQFQNYYKNPSKYLIDTTKSKLNWKCAHVGYMKFKEGVIITTTDEIKEINLSIDMNSIKNTDIDNDLLQGTLQNVLKSIEFFNTKKYPESRFESHLITKLEDNKYKIEGDFIIFENGICTNFNGTIEIKKDSLYFNTASIIIDRTDWGIYYLSKNNKYPKKEEANFVVSDTIFLEAQIVAYKTQ